MSSKFSLLTQRMIPNVNATAPETNAITQLGTSDLVANKIIALTIKTLPMEIKIQGTHVVTTDVIIPTVTSISIKIEMPSEYMRRVGQSIAAASLADIRK